MSTNDFCPKCQSSAFRTGHFCYICGTELVESPKCIGCGEKINKVDKFCSWCGEKILTQEDLEKREALGLIKEENDRETIEQL